MIVIYRVHNTELNSKMCKIKQNPKSQTYPSLRHTLKLITKNYNLSLQAVNPKP